MGGFRVGKLRVAGFGLERGLNRLASPNADDADFTCNHYNYREQSRKGWKLDCKCFCKHFIPRLFVIPT